MERDGVRDRLGGKGWGWMERGWVERDEVRDGLGGKGWEG